MSHSAVFEQHINDLAGEPNEVPEGDPAAIGVPAFLVGGIALGLVNIGYVPATAVGAPIPIIVTATGAGQFIAALWAARISQNAVATIFAVFGGFWVSYAALVLGLVHDWYGISPAEPAEAAAVKGHPGDIPDLLASGDRIAHPLHPAPARDVHAAVPAGGPGPAAVPARCHQDQCGADARQRIRHLRLRRCGGVLVPARSDDGDRRQGPAVGQAVAALTPRAARGVHKACPLVQPASVDCSTSRVASRCRESGRLVADLDATTFDDR